MLRTSSDHTSCHSTKRDKLLPIVLRVIQRKTLSEHAVNFHDNLASFGCFILLERTYLLSLFSQLCKSKGLGRRGGGGGGGEGW